MNATESQKMVLREGSSLTAGPVVEVELLLEPWLLTALEEAAGEQGLTPAALVRRLLRDFLYYADGPLPDHGTSSFSPPGRGGDKVA